MDDNTVQPVSLRRRSFVYRKLLEHGARFGEINDGAVALSFQGKGSELEAAASLGLCDLSVLPRSGFKGPGTADWLAQAGVTVPPASNQTAPQPDGSLAARLAPNELLLLSDLQGKSDIHGRLINAWREGGVPPASPRGFPMPRQDSHAWFAVTGKHAAAMFAKLCGVDLRPAKFADGSVAQTSVARTSSIVIRNDLGSTLTYYVLMDSASAEYYWDCLTDAMNEFGGRPVGLAALRGLAGA